MSILILACPLFYFFRELQRGRVKCGRYWPMAGTFELYNDFEISCIEEKEEGDDFITRTFHMKDTKVL